MNCKKIVNVVKGLMRFFFSIIGDVAAPALSVSGFNGFLVY